MEKITNRVEQSGLIQLDLSDYRPDADICEIDLAGQLWQGLVLKEKDFRAWIKNHNWSQYKDKAVFIHCSADAIVPTWAFVLVGSALEPYVHVVIAGTKEDVLKHLIREKIEGLNTRTIQEGKVIIKGCSDIPYPAFAMNMLVQRIQPHVRSIMYGEPCSTVPIYKKRATHDT
jgi:hypothetical protein